MLKTNKPLDNVSISFCAYTSKTGNPEYVTQIYSPTGKIELPKPQEKHMWVLRNYFPSEQDLVCSTESGVFCKGRGTDMVNVFSPIGEAVTFNSQGAVTVQLHQEAVRMAWTP